MASAAIEVRDSQGLRADRGGPRSVVRGRARRGVRPARPKRAGKTTTVEILEGYRDRSAGDVRACSATTPPSATGSSSSASASSYRAAVSTRARLCASGRALRRPTSARATQTAPSSWWASARRPMPAPRSPGGQRRRLDPRARTGRRPRASSSSTSPRPASTRRAAHRVGRGPALKELGKTVLLTTHYLDEAQELSDRVAIVKEGRIVAEGPPTSWGRAHRATASPTCRTVGASSTRPTTPRSSSTASRATQSRAESASTGWRSPARRSRRSTSS